jgi:4'-phosphopantetheinyl transferase EntD
MQDLLPSNVVLVESSEDDPSAYLLPEEAAQFGWAIESRKREFTTTRSYARRALSQLGLPVTPVLRGPSREPLWPSGVVGSITHCQGYRAAALAKQRDIWTVGIDAEIHDRLPAEVFEQVLVKEELTWLTSAPLGTHWDRVLFSAKESVYKAWFPLTGRWLGFEDVRVVFRPSEGTFDAHLLLAPPTIGGQPLTGFSGRFMVRHGLVLTAIAMPNCDSRFDNTVAQALDLIGTSAQRPSGMMSTRSE